MNVAIRLHLQVIYLGSFSLFHFIMAPLLSFLTTVKCNEDRRLALHVTRSQRKKQREESHATGLHVVEGGNGKTRAQIALVPVGQQLPRAYEILNGIMREKEPLLFNKITTTLLEIS